MATARQLHAAVLLEDGTVLVAGGSGSNADLDTAELYNPASGTWSFTSGHLVTARHGHTATLLPNGQVLIAGGGNSSASGQSQFLDSAELYNPVSRTWDETGSLNAGRYVHTATTLKSGKVLVVGGFNSKGNLATAELYDPPTGNWSLTGSLAFARVAHTATLLPNGKVLVTGGFGNGSDNSASELYDPESGTWSATSSLADARWGHTATLLLNGKVLVIGGFNSRKGFVTTTEIYDPGTGTWSMGAPMAMWRYNHTANLLPNGKVLVAAGTDGLTSFGRADVYDPASDSWSRVGDLAASRTGHTATSLKTGAVLIAGGVHFSNNPGVVLASAELYTPPADGGGTAANISTRGLVADSSSVMIAGFVIEGSAQKKVIIRGIGPSLSKSGVGATLQDPTLELHNSSGALLLGNDNWQSSQSAEISATGIAPSDSRESALIATLAPGAYTAQLRGNPGTHSSGFGVGLIEVYDLDSQPSTSRLANISTRGDVQLGDNALIGGFIMINKATNIVVRAMGPSLSQNGVAGALADPTLELRDANGALLGANDNWRSLQEDAITASGLAPANDAESAILVNLIPGSYTALVRGVNDSTGIALVEVYSLPR